MEINQYEVLENYFAELPIILKRSILRKSPASQAPLHFNWHESIEIIYVDDGEGTIICDFEEHSVGRGDIFIINSDVLHSLRSDSYMSYYYLIVDSNFCKLCDLDVAKIHFEGKVCDSWATSMFGAVLRTYLETGEFHKAKIRAKVLDFMVYLCEKYGSGKEESNKKHDKNFENIRKSIIYIRDNIKEKITVDQLALIAKMSKYHFIREFKRITHFTPIMYINVTRIELAKKLLSEKKMSVAEVCEKCGFENLSYFTKTYKNYTGITPSQERAKNK